MERPYGYYSNNLCLEDNESCASYFTRDGDGEETERQLCVNTHMYCNIPSNELSKYRWSSSVDDEIISFSCPDPDGPKVLPEDKEYKAKYLQQVADNTLTVSFEGSKCKT
jgi:hypothetical protein